MTGEGEEGAEELEVENEKYIDAAENFSRENIQTKNNEKKISKTKKTSIFSIFSVVVIVAFFLYP